MLKLDYLLMNLKNKILVVGPISDFGGREIEVKNITDALVNDFDVDLLSTIPMTKDSVAILNNKKHSWSTVDKKIFNSNLFIKLTSSVCKILYGRKEPAYRFIGNKLNHKFFSFNKKYFSVLKKEISKYDIIIFSGELTTKWLEEVIVFCNEFKKNIIIRTTGTIKYIPESINSLLSHVEIILVHSNINRQVLLSFIKKNVIIIDQTTLLEKELLAIEINKTSKQLTYGYLGRFSKEKGTLEMLNVFVNLRRKIIVAGSGTLLIEVKKLSKNNKHIEYIGELSGPEIVEFYKQIDVLVIPSFEESGPLVGVEAMSAGKLILSTRVGAMMDRLEKTDNQFWFDINDEKTLIEQIKNIDSLNIDVLKQIRNKNRVIYKQKYSRKVIAKQYLSIVNNSNIKSI